jgi:hypothetical protein
MSPELGPDLERQVNDGWLNEDDFLGAAEIAMQMEAFGLDGGGSGPASSNANASANSAGAASGKKKKKQKITLMSTGGHRGT